MAQAQSNPALAWAALHLIPPFKHEAGNPWAVTETPGGRTDGTFPCVDPQLALKAARGLALGVAEAEHLLLEHCTSPHLSVRASMLGRDDGGRLRFHLAALDPEVDSGFPATPATWMWTAEELFGQPETARSNVLALAWLLQLMLTGRSPYGAATDGHSESQRREALKPLVAQGKLAQGLSSDVRWLGRIDHFYLQTDYQRRRDFLLGVLEEVGSKCFKPDGADYIITDISDFGFENDVKFTQHVIKELGVAVVPGSSFYRHPELGAHQVRFCYCKKDETLQAAAERLRKLG